MHAAWAFFRKHLKMRGFAGHPAFVSAAVAAGPAAITPYAAIWLKAQGVSLMMLGAILAAPLLLRALLAGQLVRWARCFASPWMPIAMLTTLGVLAALAGWTCSNAPTAILVWWTLSLASSACTPFIDLLAVSASAAPTHAPSLGRSRCAGSLAFFGATIAIGLCCTRLGTTGIMAWASVAGLPAIAYAAWSALRGHAVADRTISGPTHGPAGPGRAMSYASPVLALVAIILIEASHGLHSVAMIAWQARGLSSRVHGELWATGILCDILFLSFLAGSGQRWGAARLLLVGGAAATVRWAGFAMAPPLYALFLLQALHALSFTATSLASVQIAQTLAPNETRLNAQITTWALTTGLAGGLTVLIAGPLYAALGMQAYWLMAGLAGTGMAAGALFERGFRWQRLPGCRLQMSE
jgi:MFS transporter, PPP family, 3-phenylpropionic acid transporter